MLLCQRSIRRARMASCALSALVLLGPLGAAAATPAALATTTLSDTNGRRVALDRYLGKPAVLFYEDRGSIAINQAVKDALIARGRQDELLGAVAVIAVANIAAYDFPPAREIATAFIRRAERRAGIPILLDASGALMAAPWHLPDGTSTVLVLDREGQVVWRRSGAVSPGDAAGMLDQLARLARAGS